VLTFAAHVAGAWAFGGGFFVEVNALPFVQLIEAAFDSAAMKEPLLAAVVANEAKTSVTNESLDRAARHPSLLGRACPGNGYQFSFHLNVLFFMGIYRRAA